MSNVVGVVIGTFGDCEEWTPWAETAMETAKTSLERCPGNSGGVVWNHAATLQEARNGGADRLSEVDWLIFLDADDQLDEFYVEEMLKVAVDGYDLVQPSTLGIYPDGKSDDFPVLIPKTNLLDKNYLVIGTMVRASLFNSVGGFDDWPVLEDWALWAKCYLAGAKIGAAPKAIYRVMVRENSRNVMNPQTALTFTNIRSWAAATARSGLR